MPAFASFTDLADPKTARVVSPEEFPKVFGPGVFLKRMHVEMVSAGFRPFGLLGSMFAIGGEPITRGVIDAKLPWLRSHTGYLAGSKPDLSNARPARNLTGNEFIKGM